MLIMMLLTMTACESRSLQPVDIEPGEMCAMCKMAISEKRYAAEAVGTDESVFKFDDVGCFLRFIRERGLKDTPAAFFAVDFESGGWIDARQAVYVKSEAVPSPMASGLLAVKDSPRAAALSAKFLGRVLTFEELWTSTR